MRPILSSATTIILAVLLLAACNSNDSYSAGKANPSGPSNLSSQTPHDGVPRITVTELKTAVDSGTVVVVDVRSAEAYALEHIKGSINIPEPATEARLSEFPRDKMIVVYCS